jgi:hypothetical protein
MRVALGLVVGSFVVVTLLTAIVLTVLYLVFMPKVAGAAGVALLRTTPLLAGVCGVTVLLVVGLELALRRGLR